MNRHRLRLKVGEHEFEAEGAPDFVKEQLAAFEKLVRPAAAPTPAPVEQLLGYIMRVEHPVVRLTVPAPPLADALLLIVFGYKTLRSKPAVSGQDVIRALDASGFRLPRADRALAKAGAAGDLFIVGKKRAKRYGLTEAGLRKARALAGTLTPSAT